MHLQRARLVEGMALRLYVLRSGLVLNRMDTRTPGWRLWDNGSAFFFSLALLFVFLLVSTSSLLAYINLDRA
jgi:hypothetical protein